MHKKKEAKLTMEHEKHKDHHHAEKDDQSQGNRYRLLSMLVLTFGYFLVEIIVGYMTNSVALIADSFHMLSDVISLVIAYIAVRMSPKKWSQNTFGWARAEVLGALINAVFLVALCFSIIVESLERFISIKEIENPKLILIVGAVGLTINLVGLLIFHEHGHSHGGSGLSHGHSHGGGGGHTHGHSHSNHNHSHNHAHVDDVSSKIHYANTDHKIDLVGWTAIGTDLQKTCQKTNGELHEENKEKPSANTSATQMNMHGVFLHLLADFLGSVIVIISALVIWLTDWEYRMYVDPVLSLLMVMLIICSVWPLLVESSLVLLQTIPTHIQIDELKKKLLVKVQEALEVHEFHVWQLAGNRIIASAHILCKNQENYMSIGEQIKQFFHNEGIHSTTIQLEFSQNTADNEDEKTDVISDKSDCFLTCPDDENADCVSNTCCGMRKRKSASSSPVTTNKITSTNNITNTNLGFIPEPDEVINSPAIIPLSIS